MLAVGSIVVVAAHSAGSSVVVVTTSARWVSAFEAAVGASGIEGAAFALASTTGSSVMA
jgi:Asp/Glu/hydantoin racemase